MEQKEKISNKRILSVITAIRNSNPTSHYINQNGFCYEFALSLKTIFKSGDVMYSSIKGHAYYVSEDRLYDITGRVYKRPRDLDFITDKFKCGHKPHRWHIRPQKLFMDALNIIKERIRNE